VIHFDDVTFTYAGRTDPVLVDVDLEIPESALCLVAGPTGSGKTTLLGAINGLVPHFTGGTLAGAVVTAGRDTRNHRPGTMADAVGYVGQQPERGFVTATVEEELAYAMEQHGVSAATMRTRVEETLDVLGLAPLRSQRLGTLSGGQAQRVAIGSVLTMHPRVLVLDEPTSALDPAAAEEVLATLHRLVHDAGITVVLAEHRLERVVQHADVMVITDGDGSVRSGDPREVAATAPTAPPVVELARVAGWAPPPLTVREARALAAPLRDGLMAPAPRSAPDRGPELVAARRLTVAYGPTIAVDAVDLDLRPGQVCVVMGRNGSGKSSLFWALQGGVAHLGSVERRGRVGLVPQTASDLLYLPSVAGECATADADADRTGGTCRRLLDELTPGIADETHPGDLSEGQRLALVLAIQLTSEPDTVLLDEPTRGLDYRAKAELASIVRRLAAAGRAVAVSTHDVEFAALVADRVVVMADGDLVADGPANEILTATPLFAPQVAKVMSPLPFLTVDDVAAAIGGATS
jgi:energy-coupling factor transporter ATP-binding protein EcfA2